MRNITRQLVFIILFGACGTTAAFAQESNQQPARPNILFAIADDWSFGHAGAYDCDWVETPSFDRIARQGLLFTRAYTPNAKCAPSRACLLTGLNSWQLKDACNHICYFPAEFKSYAEALAENGYFVGFTGKGWGPGVANDARGRPRQIAGKAFNRRKAKPPAKSISSNDYAGNFEDFLAAAPKGKPWCFWYGTTEPHRGYEYGVGVKKAGKKLTDIERVPGFWPDNEIVRNDMLDYAFEVEHFDRHLGRIIETLEKRGELENTLIVATSDHGMPFPRCKGQAYDYSNHVPLAIAWPSKIKLPGRVVNDYISFIDLAPTFIEAAGLNWKTAGMSPSPGHSLMNIFSQGIREEDQTAEKTAKNDGKALQRDHVLIGKERHDIGRPNDWGYPIRGIIKDNLLYLHNFETSRWPAGNPETGYLNCDGSPTKTIVLNTRDDKEKRRFWELCFGKRPAEELYDLKSDPDCIVNLANQPQQKATKEQLKKQLFQALKAQGDPRILGQSDYFDQIPYANAGTRNFYERYMRGEKVKAGWVNESDFQK